MSEIVAVFTIVADEHCAGERIDTVVARAVPDCSRSYAADLIRHGRITVRGTVVKPGYRLRPGDEVIGKIPAPASVAVAPEPIPLDVLYQDTDLLVLNKPAGMVVHPAPGHPSGTLVNALLFHCPDLGGIGGEIRPGIVHRLDKDTTGVLVAAKNAAAQAALAAQFKHRTVEKRYLALIHGHMKQVAGKIVMPIGRHAGDRKKMSTITSVGRAAETHWKVMERLTEASLVEIGLLTGRTHQIRVHLAAIHHAVIGDQVYGIKNAGHSPPIRRLLRPVGRQMLHARQIRFIHPVSGAEMCFQAPLPQDMVQLMEALRISNQTA